MNTTSSCRSRPLFQYLSRGLLWTLVAQISFALVLVLALVLWPLTQQSAQDKAGLLVLAVQTWLELPQGTRADFVTELRTRHGIDLVPNCNGHADLDAPWASYPAALQRALVQRLAGQGVEQARPRVVKLEAVHRLEVCLWMNEQAFTLSFAGSRLFNARLLALGLILLGSSLLAGLLALLLTRRLVRPLEGITQAAQTWEQGRLTAFPVKPSDVFEVCTLARTLEQMLRNIQQHEQARTTLLVGVSHDLRTPLARMRLALEMLPDETPHESGRPSLRDGLVRDVEAMERLIAQTLQLARAQADPQAQSAQVVDLAALASALVADQQRGGMKLRFAGAPRCPALIAPLALERILGNLLDNAWRYSHQQDVELLLHCSAIAWRFEVLDRGPGIPAELRESVFQAFTRLEPSRNPATGGSGLGLAIARQLAVAQGWYMGIAAREGGGSCVWVSSKPFSG
jgi:two-component system osmolarity sensor histidine kinase EnvZ